MRAIGTSPLAIIQAGVRPPRGTGFALRSLTIPMTPAPQAVVSADIAAPAGEGLKHGPAHLHAPSPGATATLIHDLRELFKVKVVGMVLVTGWGGFYLGSMQSGISSVQPGLLDALFGIGLVSAGAGALNEALERKTDARMIRTAQRPLARGRFSLAGRNRSRPGRAHPRRRVAAAAHQPAHRVAGPAHGLLLRGHLHAAQALHHMATFIGAFPGAMGPLLGWTAARPHIEWPAVALFAILFVWQFPHFMAISWLYRDDYARAGIRMLPVVQPDGWSTVAEALFFAVVMIPVSLAPWFLGVANVTYAVLAVLLGLLYLAYTIRFAGILRAKDETESRMLARDLLKVSVLYLPLLFTTLMLCATQKH
jgi:protoheme IX farnesyltransferase